MLGRLRIRTKLAVLLAVPLLALVATGVLGWTTLQDTKVLGPRYDGIKTSQNLIADVMPPPDNVVESYLVAYQAVSANRSARDALLQRFDVLRKAFEDGHTYWSTKLSAPSDAALRAAFLGDAYNAGHQFFTIAVQEFEPAVSRGDTLAARSALDGPMSDAYATHQRAIGQTLTLALQREQRSEHAADKFVSSRTVTLAALFAAILALAALLGIVIARSITRSIDRIRDRAREVATDDLPDIVARIESVHDHSDDIPSLPPIRVPGDDELAELAATITTLQDTAVRLATEQAVVRRNVSDVFVSLGRRNQALLSRQLAFITDLEREQTDDEVLGDLFRLDHLATRMRRNAESLLVLAGAEPSRKVQKPMSVGDVVRAALSEIEDYSRVDFHDIEPTALKGTVVTDAAHMLAELLENAASFSPPDASIEVIGRVSHDGYLLTIVDHGIGMESEMLLEANRRISQVTRLDRAPSKVLGLYVVGRLANRHGISVFLIETPNRGITAKVLVPARLVQDPNAVLPLPPPAEEETESAEQTADPISDRVLAPAGTPRLEPAAIEAVPIEAEPVAEPVAEVAPEPEPVVEVEPEPVPEPVAEVEVEPEPVPEPAAEVAPEPEPVPEPVAEVAPEPEPVPEPVAEITPERPTRKPRWAAIADLFTAPAPPVEPAPEPVAEVAPAPQPEPVAEVAPAARTRTRTGRRSRTRAGTRTRTGRRHRTPAPEPEPVAEVAPAPEPEPEPEPVAEERTSWALERARRLHAHAAPTAHRGAAHGRAHPRT